MGNFPTLTVCGCGSGGMAMAADLSMLGCTVNLYEIADLKENLDPIRENGGISLAGNSFSGKTGLAKLNRLSSDPEEALEGSELVFINVPTTVVEDFTATLAPFVLDGQTVVVTTGYWAALRSREVLRETGAFDKYTFVEQSIMPYLSEKTGPAQVHISNYKRDFSISAWPAEKSEGAYEVMKRAYPQVKLSKNVLENNFRPGNPSVHAQITIPNAAFFFDRAREFKFYAEVTETASKLADAFDEERIKVAAAFDCETSRWADWFHRTYEYEGTDLYELHGDVRCPHVQRWGSLERIKRVLVEDLCYSFVPMEALAEVAGLNVPVTTAMIQMLTVFTGFDYRGNGATLERLGLDGLDRDEIIDYVTYGQV